MKKFLLGILVGFVFAALVLVVAGFAAYRISQRRPAVPENAVLVLRLEGQIPEAPPVEIPLPFFERRAPATIAENWALLRRAAEDPHIRALVLMPQGVEAGWGKLKEIRDGIETFRKSGKPVYAYLRAPRTREYYLATAADRVYMAPEDLLDLKGLRVEAIYLRKTLDKIGVQVEVEHAGKYKDAGDMLTRGSMSPETREVLDSILDEIYGQLIEALAAGRKRKPEEMRALIEDGPFVSRQALARGLLDGLAYQDQMFDELKQRLKLGRIHKLDHADYLKARRDEGTDRGRRIALLVAEGSIVRGGAGAGSMGDGEISAPGFIRLLREVAGDASVKGAIVRIDSPGGDGFASDEIWREMNLLGKKKPLVISMSDTAASGGYYMAMTGDPILAYPGTFTGSIGVLYGKVNLRGLYEKLGVRKELLTRGRYADIDSDFTPLSEPARKKLRESIGELYHSFVSRVAEARKRSYQQIEPLAEGRVWIGSQARRNGLIDEFGGLDRAVELVKQKAGIPLRERVRLIPYPPPRTIFDLMWSRAAETSLDTRARTLVARLGLQPWLEGGILRVMPYTVAVE